MSQRFAERKRWTDCFEREDEIEILKNMILKDAGCRVTMVLDDIAQILHDVANDEECSETMACIYKLQSGMIDSVMKKISVIEDARM